MTTTTPENLRGFAAVLRHEGYEYGADLLIEAAATITAQAARIEVLTQALEKYADRENWSACADDDWGMNINYFIDPDDANRDGFELAAALLAPTPAAVPDGGAGTRAEVKG